MLKISESSWICNGTVDAIILICMLVCKQLLIILWLNSTSFSCPFLFCPPSLCSVQLSCCQVSGESSEFFPLLRRGTFFKFLLCFSQHNERRFSNLQGMRLLPRSRGENYCILGLGSYWWTHLRHIVLFLLFTSLYYLWTSLWGEVEEDAAAAVLTSTGPLADKISPFTPPHPHRSSIKQKRRIKKSNIPLFPLCWFKL